jgi:hypothetical protein
MEGLRPIETAKLPQLAGGEAGFHQDVACFVDMFIGNDKVDALL